MRQSPRSGRNSPVPCSQRGVVLLVFMLMLIVGSSFMLVSRMNEYAQAYVRKTRTQSTLAEAKQALLFYAMNYPELQNSAEKGPGYLPCPDQDEDGSAESNCTFNTASSTYTVFGRLPYLDLGLSDLRDSSGERLWYSLSYNFRNTLSDENVLNSDTPGMLSVSDGTNVTDDVVAVIIAPGEPGSGQNGRRGTAEDEAIAESPARIYAVADEYLESDNASYEDNLFVTIGGDDFNDQVVTITRQELMAVVEQRVLSEARKALSQYEGSYGAYPWLVPFADPKSSPFVLRGVHDGSDDSTNDLDDDSSRDFTQWGVAIGDTVWNLTDGSVGVVDTTPTATRLSMSGGLALGGDNDFDDGDEYVVEVRALVGAYAGTATAGSDGQTLEDTTKDFEELGVSAGDVIENITDGSSGIVTSVDGDQITVSGLTGGAGVGISCPAIINQFCPNDVYRIRTNAGQATSGSATTLVDTAADFVVMGVQAGDLVHNLTDGSYGRVATAGVAATTLTLDGLEFGTSDAFATDDYYEIARFNAVATTRKGLLPIHVPGEAFNTDLDVDWSVTSSGGNTVNVVTDGTVSNYDNGLTYWIESSSTHSGTISIDAANGECVWIAEQIADCRGKWVDDTFLSGTTDLNSSGATVTIQDTSINFTEAGVKLGDLVENTSDGLSGIVKSRSTSSFTAVSITGETAFSAGAGDQFRVSVAGSRYTDTPDWNDSALNAVCNWGINFPTFVGVGDSVRNSSEGGAVGLITWVSYSSGLGCFIYTSLQGGTASDIFSGDTYRISYNFVNERRYSISTRIRGSSPVAGVSGKRQRSVCLGYGSNCDTGPSDSDLADGNTATVTIEDYDAGGALTGSATAEIASTGTALASIRLAGIDYFLDETADAIPEWFLNNKWHRFLYAAYSSGFQPGGAGTCIAGTDCLQLSVPLPAGTTLDDRQALLISSGPELTLQASSRINGALNAWFEDDNAVDSDDLFIRDSVTTSFNDVISVVAP